MRRSQKPLRSIHEELFDVDLSYEQCKKLKRGYREFYAEILPSERRILGLMLL